MIKPCYCCNSTEFWITPDRSINCSVCHPPPRKEDLAAYEKGAKELQKIVQMQLRKHGKDGIRTILAGHLKKT